ncbi:MAG TPA: hypothetical protein VKF32_06710, partial [Thermoanaerobaculia bacterium]|nr:hypothetical protein [Thermoanaerobaculia bacterium]
NLVLASGSAAELRVDVSAVGADGAVLATKSYTLPPFGMTQVSRVLRDVGVSGPVRASRLLVSTSSDGGFTSYASLIDNVTNDPTVLLPR